MVTNRAGRARGGEPRAERRLVCVGLRAVVVRDAVLDRVADERRRVLAQQRGAGPELEPRDAVAVVEREDELAHWEAIWVGWG